MVPATPSWALTTLASPGTRSTVTRFNFWSAAAPATTRKDTPSSTRRAPPFREDGGSMSWLSHRVPAASLGVEFLPFERAFNPRQGYVASIALGSFILPARCPDGRHAPGCIG